MYYKINFVLVFLFAAILITGCKKKEEDTPTPTPDPGPAAVAGFTFAGDNVPAPAMVTFTNTSQNGTSYLWEFGDGDLSTVKNPQHTYNAGGTYAVKLTANGAGGASSITKSITIQNAPTICNITNIKLTQMPFINGATGGDWDVADGPDVFFTIENAAGNIVYSSTRFDDIVPGNLPLSWDIIPSFLITPLNTNYNIKVYDYDTLDPDDFIASFSFNPSTTTGYPSIATVNNFGATIALTLQWQ